MFRSGRGCSDAFPSNGQPWCFDQSMIDSVLNLLFGKFSFCVAVFALMSFLFCQAIWFSLFIWCSFLEKVVLRLLPLSLEALWLDQSMINSVPILLITQVFSVWLFVWIIFWFFLSFDLACLRDVPLRKRLFPASPKHWVNPGASSSQWSTPFWIFYSASFYFVWPSLLWWAFFFLNSFDVPWLFDVPF